MISHKHKCIFVHIPKTGGTSIEEVIWPLKTDRIEENLWMGFVDSYHNKYQTGALQHLTASQIRSEVGSLVFDEYYKFTVVRNPWEKAVSQFMYLKKRKYLRDFIGMSRWASFKKYLKLISKKTHVQWMKQSDFLVDSEGGLLVDEILRFEDLDSDFQKVKLKLGFSSLELPHVNKSERKRYSEYYDQESIQMVQDLYASDIAMFDYKYGDRDCIID